MLQPGPNPFGQGINRLRLIAGRLELGYELKLGQAAQYMPQFRSARGRIYAAGVGAG
jgi:hypothetical protein